MAISTISQAGLNAPITLTSPVIAGTPTGVGVLTSGTAVASTSGTSIDFTSIPSWVKRITVMFSGVSGSGVSPFQIQIGSGSVTTTGYTSSSHATNNTDIASTTGFVIQFSNNAARFYSGTATINLVSTNSYISSSNLNPDSSATAGAIGGGYITLGGTLDRVRITTVNGTDTFDAGSVNILYE